jgi:hypothetical protein
MRDYNLRPVAVNEPVKAFSEDPHPLLRLPKELQVQLYKRGWEALDVYGELPHQRNEACGVRTLEPVCSHCHLVCWTRLT